MTTRRKLPAGTAAAAMLASSRSTPRKPKSTGWRRGGQARRSLCWTSTTRCWTSPTQIKVAQMLSWSFDVLHIIFSVGMRTPLGYSWFRLTRILCYFFALPVIVLHLYSCLAYTSVRFQRERSGDETARPRCVPAIGVRALRPVHLVANLVAVAGGARSKRIGRCSSPRCLLVCLLHFCETFLQGCYWLHI